MITTREYEGYREIIRIAKKHREVEKIKIVEEEEETLNPKQTIYIIYNRKEEMIRAHIGLKEEEKIAKITAIEEQRIDMRGAVDKNQIYQTTNRPQRI